MSRCKRLDNLERTHMSLGLFLSQISLWMHIFLITLNAILVPKLTSAPGSTSLASQPEGKTISLLSSILRLAGRRGWLMKGQMHALRLSKWAIVIGSSHWTSWFRQLVERGVWETPLQKWGGVIPKWEPPWPDKQLGTMLRTVWVHRLSSGSVLLI